MPNNKSSANTTQIGGTHYKTAYEHWDLVLATGMGYFEGNLTRYITRWLKKDGIIALEKALHYVVKIKENAPLLRLLRPARPPEGVIEEEIKRFVRANDLGSTEYNIIWATATWQTTKDLDDLYDYIDHNIDQLKSTGAETAPAKAVPATDSNKHAEREFRSLDGIAEER